MSMFRDLRADEIECRIAQAKSNGVSLLLYKDARCDQSILDETVGAMNWQRSHTRDNANCIVTLWDGEKKQWISKEDTGTESNTEKEKGLASDSFKRACFNWGIGRELYTAPFIWVSADACTTLKQDNFGKWKCYDAFDVAEIDIQNKRITGLAIKNRQTGKICYSFGTMFKSSSVAQPSQQKRICSDCGAQIDDDFIADGTMNAYGRYLCRECGIKEKRVRKAAQGTQCG